MKPSHPIYLFLLLLLSIPGMLFAQGGKPTTKVTGLVVNEQSKPVEFATVSLLRAKDSSLVKGALGNDAGLYTFERVTAGTYLIKVTAVGFNKGVSKPFAIDDNTGTLKVPTLRITSSARALNTVSIQSTRPLIERKLDRTVMNVENSVLAAGNSALEILERAPGVSVDKDDNISLNGKQGVTVMINDKLTYLSAAQLATMLRSTDGSNIATIEIITNPSAKYDAAGNSGIINIKLKKNRQTGTSGSITTGAGYGRYGKGTESFSLNHKLNKLNIFSNFNHNDNKRENDLNIKRVVTSNSSDTYFSQNTNMANANHNTNYRVGADYDLTAHHTIGFVVSGYHSAEVDSNGTQTNIGRNYVIADSTLSASSIMHQTYNNFAINLNDRLQLDTLGQELDIDLDYSKFNNNSNANYANYFYLANGVQQKDPLFLRNQTPSSINIHSAKVDYTYPLSKTVKLETGAKFSKVETDNNLQAQLRNSSGDFVNDTTRTNHFIYQEKIDAGYLNLSKTFKHTSVQAGLRAEYTNSVGTLINTGEVAPRNYLDFFPSLFVNQTLNNKNEIGFSYSRRIDRPGYDDLNPFVYYLDQYTYHQGNPFLKPQYTHSFELNYTWNKSINISLNYSRTSDVITEIILTDTVKKATYQTSLNLQVQNAYSLNINAPYTINKWWTGNANLNTFYLGFKSTDFLGANLNNGQLACQLKATQTLTFIKGYRLEVMGNYQSPLTVGIYKILPKYNVDAGINHPFANKRANLKLSVSDIFNTRRNNLNSMYQTVNLEIRQHNESRVTRLVFTYNFGNTKIKARNHKTGADEESGRVKGSN